MSTRSVLTTAAIALVVVLAYERYGSRAKVSPIRRAA